MASTRTHTPARQPVPLLRPDPLQGLTRAQAAQRQAAGWANLPVDTPTRSVGQIVRDNTCTFFNLIFVVLAVCLVLVQSFQNMLFLVIAAANTVIGIVQQIRSKRIIDRLNLLSAPLCTVVREGQAEEIPTSQAVRDDVVELSAGDQITADALVLSGGIQVNEALVTGEADAIEKKAGDELLSGSFVVAGRCRACLTRVGADSFAARLTLEAKRSHRTGYSEMMRSLDKLIRVIGIALIPVGLLLFAKELWFLDRPVRSAVESTVAALVGMIPEGLYLLTSVALAVGVLRLARDKVLVQEMSCIETLARVDVLCVDKTGTITAPQMAVHQLIPLEGAELSPEEIRRALGAFYQASDADNHTGQALRDYFAGGEDYPVERVIPFTSATKWSAVVFRDRPAWVVGAPDFILGSAYEGLRPQVETWSERGYRVLLAARCAPPGPDGLDPAQVSPMALILLANPIRPEAPGTFSYFHRQGVAVKVISGDHPATVAEVARQAGIPGAEDWVDASRLTGEGELEAAAEQYTVFGRVTPDQKRVLIRAMKSAGHTVAMTGDGVNDVLALKDADCGIAMASGSDAACHAAHLVLLHSDFSAMPKVVDEGRRVINNIQRSASLFLVKNIFSFLLAIITLAVAIPYPFVPIQMSMISGLTIGIPAFFLALEPNYALVEGRFMHNVLRRAFPGGLTDLLLVLGAQVAAGVLNLPPADRSTLSTLIAAGVGLIVLFQVCQPFDLSRKIIWGTMAALVVGAVVVTGPIFSLTRLGFSALLTLAAFLVAALPLYWGLVALFEWGSARLRSRAGRPCR